MIAAAPDAAIDPWSVERALEDAVGLDLAAVHGLPPAVHGAVGLEDPAHLAPLDRGPLGQVEVLDVEGCRHAGVLVLGLDAEEAYAAAVDDLTPAQEVPPAEGEQAAVHLAQDLVDVGDGDGDG